MAEHELSSFDPETAAAIRAALAGLDDLWRRLAAASRAAAAEGSPAAADRALPEARLVSLLAAQALVSAIDHLLAWRLLINGPTVPILAHLTLLRGALEGADRCRWLVDARLDSRTRVARGYAAKRDDFAERGKFEMSAEAGSAPRPPIRGMTAAKRVAELDARRDAGGIRSVGFTDATALAIAYGHERWFRLASAAAHGKEWALNATRLEPSADLSSTPGVVHGVVSASEAFALALTRVAVGAVVTALGEFETYKSSSLVGGRGA